MEQQGREILFRGRRVDNGEWVYGNYAFCDCFTEQQHYIFQNKPFDHAVIPATVGQYTGLTDKNGVKIFEGDICSVDGEDGLFSIQWSINESMFRIEGDGLSVDFDNYYPYELEVIGNIHDNQELLKDGGEE